MTNTDTLARRGVHAVGLVLAELGWFFREQPISDHGIDAQVEAPDELGRPSGRLLALQIKAGAHWFTEISGQDIIFRGEPKHLDYWSHYDLPVVIVLYDPKTYNCYWQLFSLGKVERTPKAWKLRIPLRNILDADALRHWMQRLGSDHSVSDPLPALDAVLEYCSAQIGVTLAKVGRRYRPDLYIARQPDAQILSALRAHSARSASALVLIERAGSGKTNLACHIALELVHAGSPCVFLLGSDPLDDRLGLVAEVLAGLGLDHEQTSKRAAAQRSIRHALDGRPLIILIDAINEARNVERMRDALSELFALTASLPVQFLVTCRDIYWSFLKGDWVDSIDTKLLTLDLYRFDAHAWPDVRERYFRHFQVRGELMGAADEQCRHPLLFRFFCEAYAGEDVSVVRQIRLKPLFERYLTKKVERLAAASSVDTLRPEDAYTGALESIAMTMLETRQASLPESIIPELLHDPAHRRRDSVYVRLLDEDVILDEVPDGKAALLSRRVRFVYEAFLEFMLARVLSRRWHSLEAGRVIAELGELLEPSSSMRNVLGAMAFLDDFFAQRGIKAWSELAERAPAWQGLVLGALREADPEHLPVDMLQAFPALVRSGNHEVRVAALALLEKDALHDALDPEDDWLRQALTTDPRREVRLAALKVLEGRWELLTPPARLAVLVACVDPSKDVRWTSTRLIPIALDAEHSALLPILLDTLRSHRSSTRSFATIALDLKLWPQARPHLLDALADPNSWVRRAALIRLKEAPDPSDIARISSLIDDPHPAVRVLTANLCREWKMPELTAAIERRLHVETDAIVISSIIAALTAQAGSAAFAPKMIGLLRHPAFLVRRRAASAIHRMLGTTAMNELVLAFNEQRRPNDIWYAPGIKIEEFGGTRGIAALLASRFAGTALEPGVAAFVAGLFLAPLLEDRRGEDVPSIDEILAELSQPLLEPFLHGMRSTQHSLHWAMKNAPSLEKRIARLVFHEHVGIARHAAYVLAAYGDAPEFDAIERIESHSDPSIREAFAWGLVRGLPAPGLSSLVRPIREPGSSESVLIHLAEQAVEPGFELRTESDVSPAFDTMDDDIPF